MKSKCELTFTREFLKKLKRLNQQTQIRILRELKILESQPYASKQLVGRLSDLMSFRVGNYRIIYQVSEKTVIVRTVGHRKKVYKE